MTFYGQSAIPEDAIAAAVFGDYVGVCCEVGAYDGVHLSNCYHFYLKGWKCINFEPHPDNYAALCRNQPKAINVNAAVLHQDRPTQTIMTVPEKPIMTGFDMPAWYIESEAPNGYDSLRPMEVPTTRLDTFFLANNIETVDYASIDVDGREMQVLEGMGLMRWQPRLLIVEYNHALTLMTRFLQTVGYRLAHTNSINGFWIRTQADYDAVQRAVR